MQVIYGSIILFVLLVGAAILIKIAPFLLIIFVFILLKIFYDIYMQKKKDDASVSLLNERTIYDSVLDKKDDCECSLQKYKNNDYEFRKKVNQIATKYVAQFMFDVYPRYKLFDEEEVLVFEMVLRESLSEEEIKYLKNISIQRILQIKYNNSSYNAFKEKFVADNNLTSDDDFVNCFIAYLNNFDENIDGLYYFCRFIRDNKIKLISDQNTKKYDRHFRQKIIKFHSLVPKAVDYYEKLDISKQNMLQAFYESFIEDFYCIAQIIEQRIRVEKKAKIAKHNMETGSKVSGCVVSINDVDGMDGFSFEHLLGRLFKQMNYKVEVTRGSGDQGADLVISKMGVKTVVQAKCYFNNVSNKAIQEVVAAMAYYGAENGMVVTNSYFTKGAKELAEANNIALWDRDKLTEKLSMYSVVDE